MNPNNPKIIEGIPARQSVPKRIILVALVSLVYSVRYTDVKIPKGVAIIMASKGSEIVPIIVGKIPPALPISRGLVNRKSILRTGNPFSRMKTIININIRRVRIVAPPKIATAPRWVYFG